MAAWRRLSLLLLLLLLVAALYVRGSSAAPDWTDCPSACRCKWTSGKKTALCRDAGLSALPGTLNSDMQVLDLSGNSIPYLAREAFRSVGLLNLQRVFMRGARLRELHRDAFRDLIILVEVDLSENEIARLDPQTFRGNDRLRVLYLNGNPLGELGEAQFPALPHLRTLELQSCQLHAVHRDAFVHLVALEALNLRSNRLRQLSEAVFMSTGRLNTLDLDGNPWRCDCQLRGFRNWFLSSNLRSVALRCSEPHELDGRPWDAVPAEEFACAPSVSLTGSLVQAEVGGNVTFGCNVRGDPEPEVTWYYNGRPIGSPGPNGSSDSAAVAQSPGSTQPGSLIVIEVEEGLLEKWTNVSVLNVSEVDAGEYSCVARNRQGLVARNVTLVLPEVVTATTLSKAEVRAWVLWLGVACGLAAALLASLAAACCAWSRGRRRRKRHRRKPNLKGSVSFSDQEKKLLDVSITTSTDRTDRGSCELLQPSAADMELLEHSPSGLELCGGGPGLEQPVHITIEAASHGDHHLPVSVFPPPPPEFSTSMLPAGAFGNIFISVSVSQEPHQVSPLDVARYPDLLDIARRDPQAAAAGLGTLPRRQRGTGGRTADTGSAAPPPPVHYDNMGPRVTAGGSSTLSLPDAVAPSLEDIPPPPPPPACTPHTSEYVSL